MTGRLLAHFQVAAPQELIPIIGEKRNCAECAPLAFAAAEAGDVIARQLIEEGACELALAASTAVRSLTPDAQDIPLVLAGGVLVNHGRYRELALEKLRAVGVNPNPVQVVQEPATGALRLAMKLVRT